MKFSLNKNKFYFLAWLLYSTLTLAGILHHEPNRDEAQVWLIVRDLNLSGIFSQINLEGHPCLWYLIVLPFAKAGFPYITMQILHWLTAITAVALFLFKAPLNNLLKYAFVFSFYMIFQYSVITRNYSIVILFLFLIATYYNSRFSHPYRFAFLLIALFNSHVLAFGAGLCLTILYFIDACKEGKLKNIKYPLALIVLGCLSAIIQLWPAAHFAGNTLIRTTYIPPLNIDTYWVILTGIQNAFIPVFAEYEELKVALFFTIVLALFVLSSIRKLPVFSFLLISSCWLLYVFTTLHPGSWRHEGLFLIFLIFSFWIETNYTAKDNLISKKITGFVDIGFLGKALKLMLLISLSVNVVFGFSNLKKEYLYSYSGAKEMAGYITSHQLQNNEIACYRSWRATSLAPYLPRTKLWFIDRKEYGTYFSLDSVFYKYGDALPEKEVIRRTKEKYKNKALLLLNEPLSLIPDGSYDFKLLYENKIFNWGTNDEKYFLYEMTFKNNLTK